MCGVPTPGGTEAVSMNHP